MSDNPTPNPNPRACCAWCGLPITGPLWKRWCSDACKMRAYRERKKRVSVTTKRNEPHHPDCACDVCYYGADRAKWINNPSEY